MNKNYLKTKVVVFTKNEDKTLSPVIAGIKKYISSIIVVDGHSSDNTQSIAKAKGVDVLIDQGKGKGAAIRFAIENINADILLFMDADGSHKPEEIPGLIEPILNGKADMVIASRMLGLSDEFYGNLGNLMHLCGNRLSSIIINLLWGRNEIAIRDCQNGYRAIKTRIARKLNLKENTFAIEQEMVIKCLKKKYRILEIPSHELKRKSGKSHINPLKELHRYIMCFINNLIYSD